MSHTLDSGFRRSDGVVISYAIALQGNLALGSRERRGLYFKGRGLLILRLNCDFPDSGIAMIGKSCQSVDPMNHSSNV